LSAAVGKGRAPFNIAADKNQGVWVDIYIPKQAPLGPYAGTLTVTANSVTVAQLPIQLQVMDSTPPDTTHYKSMVFYSRENIAVRHNTG
jgi:uncharacterized membrane protein